ncbi:MAG: prepilin-type N-terminal cleavage/methylation domain-containing protein [Rubrivivax sp.]|nr:prepilin-type N-terminal cleavage/methylation domain-containing protein [Rubrivivax sp.]
MRAQPANNRQHGLTLLELVMTLAVLAVLSALALPSFSAQMDQRRLAGAAEALLADINEGRFEAAHQRRSLHLVVQPGAAWCWAVALEPGCPCGQTAACALKSTRPVDHPSIVLSQAQPLQLLPAGLAGGAVTGVGSAGTGAAVLESRSGQQLRLDMHAMGRGHWCTLAGPPSRYPPC